MPAHLNNIDKASLVLEGLSVSASQTLMPTLEGDKTHLKISGLVKYHQNGVLRLKPDSRQDEQTSKLNATEAKDIQSLELNKSWKRKVS